MTADPSAMEQRATAALRDAGRRVTRPRVAVLAVLLRSGDRHMSADEVLAEVSAVGAAEPTAHRATVYRTLESLTSDGLLHHVHLDRGLTAYHAKVGTRVESTDDHTASGTDRATISSVGHSGHVEHLHAQCRDCGQIVDLPADALGDASRRIESATGFHLDASHVALSGVCRTCALESSRQVH